MTTVTIPARFNGPVDSGNGGYVCGVIAGVVGEGTEVTLRLPPPLETPLEVVAVGDGFEIRDRETLVAEARVVGWDIEVPDPPSIDDAADASSRYRGFDEHIFGTCFTCGTDRDDGLAIWPGRVEGRSLVASPWRAPDGVAGPDGLLPGPIVWAALDCPGAWASSRDIVDHPVVLGRMVARILEPLRAEADYVSYGWEIGSDGRKSYAGTAVATTDGRVLGYARQTWITLQS